MKHEEPKSLHQETLEGKYEDIVKKWTHIENTILGKTKIRYQKVEEFFLDIHRLSRQIDDFVNHYFKSEDENVLFKTELMNLANKIQLLINPHTTKPRNPMGMGMR